MSRNLNELYVHEFGFRAVFPLSAIVHSDHLNYWPHCQPIQPFIIQTRQTREEWPLLTVETEANGDLGSTNERGPSLVGSLGLSCRYKRFLSCLCCPSRPSSKYFLPHLTLFQFICPHCLDGRAVSPVSKYVSLIQTPS
jgi:hypothetical protein